MEEVVFSIFSVDEAEAFILEELFDCSLHIYLTFLAYSSWKTVFNFITFEPKQITNSEVFYNWLKVAFSREIFMLNPEV